MEDVRPAVRADEQAMFAEFVRPHWAAMARLARRMCGADGEDVVQDALSLAWRTRDRFEPERGSPRAWLLTLVADQSRKNLGRSTRWLRSTAMLVDDPVCAGSEVGLDIERTLRTLTGRQRLAAELFYFIDLPVAEIALVMQCSEGTVKSTLSDARARLRETLGSDYR